MTMAMAQKINRTGGWTPVVIGDRVEAMTCLRCREMEKRGKWETGYLQKGALPKLLCIIFS